MFQKTPVGITLAAAMAMSAFAFIPAAFAESNEVDNEANPAIVQESNQSAITTALSEGNIAIGGNSSTASNDAIATTIQNTEQDASIDNDDNDTISQETCKLASDFEC